MLYIIMDVFSPIYQYIVIYQRIYCTSEKWDRKRRQPGWNNSADVYFNWATYCFRKTYLVCRNHYFDNSNK